MEFILTPDAPSPGGHYSQGVVHNGLVYVSGQLSFDSQTGQPKSGTIEEETQQALQNVAAIVRTAGGDIHTILKLTIYVADIEMWGSVNQVYAQFFGEHRPARAVIPVKELHYGLKIEIEAIAAVE